MVSAGLEGYFYIILLNRFTYLESFTACLYYVFFFWGAGEGLINSTDEVGSTLWFCI